MNASTQTRMTDHTIRDICIYKTTETHAAGLHAAVPIIMTALLGG